MKLSRRLPRLLQRLGRLQSLIGSTSATTSESQIYAAERAILQIQVEWEQFTRNFILDCATGKFSNSNGLITSRSFTRLENREVAAHKLITLYPRRTFEPDWYLPSQAIDAAGKLDISNFPDVSAEIGITPWPIDDLRYIRNFIAHKSKRSALTIRSTNLVRQNATINIVSLAREYGTGGVMRYEEWINFIKGAAHRLTN